MMDNQLEGFLHSTSPTLPPGVAHAICVNTTSLTTLTTLARTSRLFYHYACQEIWHTLPSFVPIFWTMPSDAYRRERNATFSRLQPPSGNVGMLPVTLKATRPLKPDDLARFSLYAPFVRRIIPPQSSGSRKNTLIKAASIRHDVSPELWVMLQAIWPSQPFLNTEILIYRQRVYIDEEAYAHPLHLLVGPSLKHLDFQIENFDQKYGPHDCRTIDTTMQDPSLEVFFQRLPQLAPHITTFAFTMDRMGVFARGALSEALCRLSQLTSVTVTRTALSPQAIYHLSTLPALQHLELRLPPQVEPIATTCPPGASGTFTALRKLCMHASQLDECTDFLRYVSSPALHTIATDIPKRSSARSFQALASAISALPSSASIHSLTFTALRWNEGLPPESFLPLLPLSSLDELNFIGVAYAAIEDATLRLMAQSWPKIRVLKLYDWVDSHTPQHAIQTTVHGLRYFAQCCPDLEHLDVPLADISAETFAHPASTRAHPSSQLDPSRPHLLERLGVGRPKLHNEAALAACLSSIFPALIYIDCCWDEVLSEDETEWERDDREILDRWSALYRVYQAFVRIRVEERSWRAAQTRSVLHEDFRSLSLI